MLSEKTTAFINEICDFSDNLFYDGGANYIFKYGRKLAHCLQEKHNTHLNNSRELNQTHLMQLQTFIHRSQGGNESEAPCEEVIRKCSTLLDLLLRDISYEHVYIVNYSDDDYTAELKIVMIKENDYYSLEFMWGMD